MQIKLFATPPSGRCENNLCSILGYRCPWSWADGPTSTSNQQWMNVSCLSGVKYGWMKRPRSPGLRAGMGSWSGAMSSIGSLFIPHTLFIAAGHTWGRDLRLCAFGLSDVPRFWLERRAATVPIYSRLKNYTV